MNRSFEQYHRDVIHHGGIMRAALRAAEPVYSAIVSARNSLFAGGIIASRRVARPVISVGNITTGGTGKTPVVHWLAERLTAAGEHPAILLRGYKGGDEHQMLRDKLPGVIVEANPKRVEGARRVIESHPDITVFLLDDGFQHRKIHRDFDLVLIDESNPFGFNHVLPRGLLREPLCGLARANAFLLTHVNDAEDFTIEQTLRKHNATAPVYRSQHVHTALRDRAGNSMALSELAGKKVMTFCGIGNPKSFGQQIKSAGATLVDSQWFDDHHHYTAAELEMLQARAIRAGAQMLITTEKDWVKVQTLGDTGVPIWRAELAIRFAGNHEARLFEQITGAMKGRPS